MRIRTSCPSCGKRFEVKEDRAGKKFRCTNCGSPVRVPRRSAQSSADDEFGALDYEDEFDRPRQRRSTRKKKRRKSPPGRLIAVIAAVFVVSCLGIWLGLRSVKDVFTTDITDTEPDFWRVQVDGEVGREVRPPSSLASIELGDYRTVLFPPANRRWCLIERRAEDRGEPNPHELWDIYSRQRVGVVSQELNWQRIDAVSADGKYVVGTDNSNDIVTVCCFAENRLRTFDARGSDVHRLVALLPNERLLIATTGYVRHKLGRNGYMDAPEGPGRVRIWDLRTNKSIGAVCHNILEFSARVLVT